MDDCSDSERRDSTSSDHLRGRDSGIDSSQASPSPNRITEPTPSGSPTPLLNNGNRQRRPSSALLHPDHARLLPLQNRYQKSSNQSSIDDLTEYLSNSNSSVKNPNTESTHTFYLHSPSTTSSMTSMTSVNGLSGSNWWVVVFHWHRHRVISNGHGAFRCTIPTKNQSKIIKTIISIFYIFSDVLQQQQGRRRSMTTRYSLFDALDLECALLRAAARGSVGAYSLSESLHKLTFTQSLAFPALARGLATANKQRRMGQQNSTRPSTAHESLLNTFAKVITAVVLFVVSILVFLIVYKFVKTWGLLLTQNDGLLSLHNNNNINNKTTASGNYFNFYQPTSSNIKPMATEFDSTESKHHAQNMTDSFPPLINNTIRYNDTYSRRRNFSIRHNHSTYRKIKRISNSTGIR